jgi:hypothetical protein
VKAWTKLLNDLQVFERQTDDVWRRSKADIGYLALLREQALAMRRTGLTTRADWEYFFPVRRWVTTGPHEIVACVGWWHRLRWRRWRQWQRMVEEFRPVGLDIRLGLCLW